MDARLKNPLLPLKDKSPKPKALSKRDSATLFEAVQRAFGLHAETRRGAFYGFWDEEGRLVVYPLEHKGRVS